MSAYPANSSKGARYLGELDQALCSGEWSKVPELARKTEKHAPQRRCFTITARTEAQIASATSRATSTVSPPLSNYRELATGLNEAIAKEEKYPDDVYAANICLAEIHWLQGDLNAVAEVLNQDGIATTSIGNRAVALGWLEVCEVKGDLFRIEALDKAGKDDEVRQRCLSVAKRTPGSRIPELRRWTERLLGRVCLSMVPRTATPTLEELSQSIRCFASWADFWQRSSKSAVESVANPANMGTPRRTVWKAYYDLVSVILQHGLMYNPSPKSTSDLIIIAPDNMSANDYLTAKVRQRSAMRKVEMAYESLLLTETQFPKASQANTEVEEWVQQVISNWKILTGPTWTDAELGNDGKEILSRGVLDILYRAASKTYHSTAILRYLFTVHAALGEFDLAMHAFNSYVEIISKEKARAEKTGSYDPGMDSGDCNVITAAEAVRVLCRYGDREQGERAIEVSKMIKTWVNEEHPSSVENAQHNGDGAPLDAGSPHPTHRSPFQPKTLAVAYRAIGIAQAHWARLTYETESRSSMQTEALNNLRIAQKYDEDDVETAYALGLLLAESRNVPAAAKVVKHVFVSANSAETGEDESEVAETYGRKRTLIPVWHLLALCSTAKDEYEQGVKMCEAAFEQFGDESVLFGDSRKRSSGEDEKASPQRSRGGLVDLMDVLEKESLLQIRMSQLTFVELMEGPEAALDNSHELLALYARLFGNPELNQTPVQKPPATAASTQPSKLGGTLRSIAGSIRPKSARQSAERDPRVTSTVSLPTREKTESDGAQNGETFGVPISITVTNEDGVRTEKSHHHRHLAFMRRGFHNETHSSLRKKRSFRMEDRPSTPTQISRIPENAAINTETPLSQSTVEQSTSTEDPASPEQPLKEMEHNEPHDKWPPPPGHTEQPPRQDVRLPAPDPSSNLMPNARLPSARDRQQKISLLLKIWLFIGGLYLRSELLDDAASAITEATQLVESFESEVAAEHSSARRFYEKGWGIGESVDALWADVFSARGYLAVARELPFEAISHYEQALAHFPDHADAIIGLSKLLMDIYEEKLPAEEPKPLLSSQPSPSSSSASAAISPAPQPPMQRSNSAHQTDSEKITASTDKASKRDLTPAELNRLAARDRAYMLLSNLTRLGSGWDNSEAWYTLARAYELSKQVGKAKQALWWVVELEESEPMRPWRDVAAGGFTL